MRTFWALLPACFLSVACQSGSMSSATPSRSESYKAACPPNGAMKRTSEGREFIYMGSDPSDPEVCEWSVSGRAQKSRILYGIGVAAENEHAEENRQALRKIFPLEVGKSASYSVLDNYTGRRVSYTVVSEQTITVPAGTFDTFLVENSWKGELGNNFHMVERYWIDKDSSVVVKVESNILNGYIRGRRIPSWDALRVSVPNSVIQKPKT